MQTSDNIRKASKNIVMAHAQHIRDRVVTKDKKYLLSGVDENFTAYEELFRSSIAKALGIPYKSSVTINRTVLRECVSVLKVTIDENGYSRFLKNKILARCVFEVCVTILDQIKEDEFNKIVN